MKAPGSMKHATCYKCVRDVGVFFREQAMTAFSCAYKSSQEEHQAYIRSAKRRRHRGENLATHHGQDLEAFIKSL